MQCASYTNYSKSANAGRNSDGERQTHQRCDECVSEITTKYINKAIAIITDYIQRASNNETLQEIKNCLDKNILLSNDENCDQGMLMAVFISTMDSHTRETFFEEITVVLEGPLT